MTKRTRKYQVTNQIKNINRISDNTYTNLRHERHPHYGTQQWFVTENEHSSDSNTYLIGANLQIASDTLNWWLEKETK